MQYWCHVAIDRDVFEIETNQAFDVVVFHFKTHAPLVPKWTKCSLGYQPLHMGRKSGKKN